MSVSSMLIGRLGNSMFQIAASIGYATKYGHQWEVQEHPHNGESAIHRVYPNLPKTNSRGVGYQEHPSKHCQIHNQHYDECHFNYHPIPDMGVDVYLRGFWQSYKYFEHCQDEVKKVFELPHVSGYEDYVSIHVRRGDYVKHSGSFPPIGKEYIYEAIFKVFERNRSRKFIFFSDDIQWCKDLMAKGHQIIIGEPVNIDTTDFYFEFSEGRTELEDLSLMASCGDHIIANSTFSWWGAYLGHNPDRIVISPSAETWFGPTSGVKQPVRDLILPNWIQIHTR